MFDINKDYITLQLQFFEIFLKDPGVAKANLAKKKKKKKKKKSKIKIYTLFLVLELLVFII